MLLLKFIDNFLLRILKCLQETFHAREFCSVLRSKCEIFSLQYDKNEFLMLVMLILVSFSFMAPNYSAGKMNKMILLRVNLELVSMICEDWQWGMLVL